MLRFVMNEKRRHIDNGLETTSFFTVDAAVPELEAALTAGGYGNGGYHYNELVGVEVLSTKPKTAQVEPDTAGEGNGENSPLSRSHEVAINERLEVLRNLFCDHDTTRAILERYAAVTDGDKPTDRKLDEQAAGVRTFLESDVPFLRQAAKGWPGSA